MIALILSLIACGPAQKPGAEGDATAPKSGGMLQNKGSDTMVNMAQALAEEYRKVKPEVAIAVSGGGSGTGIAALENGTVDIANASREIKAEENEKIKTKTGKEPVQHIVAYDGLAIYVHKDNPLEKITKAQLAAIYGEGGATESWKDLGVEVPGCADQAIVRVSRQNNSGTYEYFREWTLGKGDFKLGSRDMQGSKDVVDLVRTTPCAIGYSGLGYDTPDVKMLCVSVDDTATCATPSVASVHDKSYPISRPLYMYTPGEGSADAQAYITWIRGDAGQAIVERSGFVPLPPEQRAK